MRERKRLRATLAGSASRFKPDAHSRQWQPQAGTVGVDVKAGAAGIIHGVVVAEAGVFNDERGRFDERSLNALIDIWPKAGLPSHVQHATMLDDKMEMYLGRMVNPRRGLVLKEFQGAETAVAAVRADLVFDKAATIAPGGNLPAYVMARCESDPASLSTSLVVVPDCEGDGYNVPALWIPAEVFGSDIVDQGAAVGAMLGRGHVARLHSTATPTTTATEADKWENMLLTLRDCPLDELRVAIRQGLSRRAALSGSGSGGSQGAAPAAKPLYWFDSGRVVDCGILRKATFEEMATR